MASLNEALVWTRDRVVARVSPVFTWYRNRSAWGQLALFPLMAVLVASGLLLLLLTATFCLAGWIFAGELYSEGHWVLAICELVVWLLFARVCIGMAYGDPEEPKVVGNAPQPSPTPESKEDTNEVAEFMFGAATGLPVGSKGLSGAALLGSLLHDE